MTDLIPGVAEAKLAAWAAKMAGPLIGIACLIGAGIVAAEVYEHKAPWGLGPKLAAANSAVAARDATWSAIFAKEKASFDLVDGALKDSNAAVARLGAASTRQQTAATSAWSTDKKGLQTAQAKAADIAAIPPSADGWARSQEIYSKAKEQLR